MPWFRLLRRSLDRKPSLPNGVKTSTASIQISSAHCAIAPHSSPSCTLGAKLSDQMALDTSVLLSGSSRKLPSQRTSNESRREYCPLLLLSTNPSVARVSETYCISTRKHSRTNPRFMQPYLSCSNLGRL